VETNNIMPEYFIMTRNLLLTTSLIALSALSLPANAQTPYARETTTTTRQNTNQDTRATTRNDVTATPNIYIGGYGGYGWTDLDTNGPDFDVNGGDYGIFAGIGLDALTRHTNMDWGVTGAIEGFYGWSDADDSSFGTEAAKDHEWGVNFRPGMAFLDRYSPMGMKPYGIIGYRRANFEVGGADEDFNGFELGLGTELLAYNDFGVRLDYSHVWYGEENGIDPDENDLRLGVAYHF
jgi:hypothetical protein